MSPEVSKAAGTVAQVLGLAPGPTLTSLQQAAARAKSVEELPRWALNVLSVMRPQESK